LVLAGGRLDSAERADVAARHVVTPVPYAHSRVAEISPPSAARENGAR
jgi:hypothetical protein